MASTQVTLKLEAFELQLIRDALRVYTMEMVELGAHGEALSAPVPVYDGDARFCANRAKLLIESIGLKSADERPPQLRMFQATGAHKEA